MRLKAKFVPFGGRMGRKLIDRPFLRIMVTDINILNNPSIANQLKIFSYAWGRKDSKISLRYKTPLIPLCILQKASQTLNE